ncbi:amidohydrolase family protein [Nocardioides speluncae]|uniref:amidohydrolase family protein n=1 Tax=Nocardioides speluncae TaxID=2670337 RepID=UPI000D6861A7|nr:amidohydrolase family protein [Nocardioides speluncae]
MIVDSHVHVWDLAISDYAWLGPQHGPLNRSFSPAESTNELAAAGITAGVLVQAEDSTADTAYLLDVAERYAAFVGVVGWVQLDDRRVTAAQLAELAAYPQLRGIRHLVHDDPRDDFLLLPEVRTSLALVADAGLAFDVPDAWPRHLAQVAGLAAELAQLTVVIDHLGKPPRGSGELADWELALRTAAVVPNTVAKVSGLHVEGQPFTADALRPVWETALDAFGPARLMYGGDWPVSVLSGGYGAHWQVLSELIGELTADEQDLVLHGTATRAYGLGVLAERGETHG